MAEYWLISAPGEKSRPQAAYESLRGNMTGLCPVFKFQIPELKVITLQLTLFNKYMYIRWPGPLSDGFALKYKYIKC